MNSDHITDSLGRSWQLGAPLGRGTWGQSRSVRDPSGREAVLKLPLGPGEGADPAACAAVAREQIDFVQDHAFGLAASERGGATGSRVQSPRIEATVELGDGRVGLIYPRYATLERRLEQGLPLSEALAIVHRIASALADAQRAHGNLKPSNVWFGERGELLLADPCTATAVTRAGSLRGAEGAGRAFLPPEAGSSRLGASHDTWALCQVLWASVHAQHQPAAGGVDKLALATAKDRAHAAFSTEGSNPRFRGRLADRVGALLSRGLSPDREPSPPYRFESLRELADRLAEVQALIRPKVVDVGRLLPPASARDAVFSDPKGLVGFSVTVGCTPGVADADDLVCGLLLTDLDKTDPEHRPLRVPVDDADVEVQAHPSGRLRFQFSVAAVPPGRYRLRVAFAVKDGGDEPQVATTDFEVRPPPGYVPPPPAPSTTPAALPFPRLPRAFDAGDPPSGEERLTDPGEDDRGSDPRSDAGPRSEPGGRGSPVAALPRPAPTVRGPAPEPPDDTDPSEDATPVGAVVRFPRPIAPPEDDTDDPTVHVSRAPALHHRTDPGSLPTPRFAPLTPPPPGEEEPLDTEELIADTGDVPLAPAPATNVVPLPTAPRPAPPAAPSSAPPTGGPSIPPPALLDANPATEPDDVPLGEDLPGYGGQDAGWRGTFTAAVDLLRRDRYLSVGVAVASCLVVVLLLTVLLKTC